MRYFVVKILDAVSSCRGAFGNLVDVLLFAILLHFHIGVSFFSDLLITGLFKGLLSFLRHCLYLSLFLARSSDSPLSTDDSMFLCNLLSFFCQLVE